MAGIGFELRKLYEENGIISNLKAYSLSTLVTVGPTSLCILVIVAMQLLMDSMGVSFSDKQLFTASITYAFAFSLILTGGIALTAARYVSDLIFQKKMEGIASSFYGFIITATGLAAITGFLFLIRGNISGGIAFLGLLLYIQLSVIWIEAVYLSAIKDYLTIALIFLAGMVCIVVSVAVCINFTHLSVVSYMLVSLDIGFLVMLILFAEKIQRTFGTPRLRLRDCFEFLNHIDGYSKLLLIGFLYYFGMYGHNFTFWPGTLGIHVQNTFIFAPAYDIAAFYALLSIMPALVIFMVKMETTVYKDYKEYYTLVRGIGSVKDITVAKKEMIKTLVVELKYIMEMQLFITFGALYLGMKLLPRLGISGLSYDILNILILGAYCFIIMYVVCMILLYFNDLAGVLKITAIFVISSVLLSTISQLVGESFYGYGFFYAGLITMIVAIFRLRHFLKDIDYYTFSAQPLFQTKKEGIFFKAYNLLNRFSGGKNEVKS